MTGWLIFGAYVVAWIVAAGLSARLLARTAKPATCSSRGSHTSFRDICRRYDGPDCWRSPGLRGMDGGWTLTFAGMAALVWPLMIPVLAAYWLAVRKPAAIASQQRIAELERELGIGAER